MPRLVTANLASRPLREQLTKWQCSTFCAFNRPGSNLAIVWARCSMQSSRLLTTGSRMSLCLLHSCTSAAALKRESPRCSKTERRKLKVNTKGVAILYQQPLVVALPLSLSFPLCLRMFIYNMPLTCKSSLAILLAVTFVSVHGFLVQVPDEPWKKCYRAEHSPDKTLQARFGILRRERYPCKMLFTVTVKNEADEIIENVHSNEYLCSQVRPGDPYVVKHTNTDSTYGGYYELCLEVIQNSNPDCLVEIFIGQRLNPIIYSHSQGAIPLVQTQELIDLDLTVQAIKRSLVKTQLYAKEGKAKADVVDAKINQLMQLNTNSTLIQIAVLIAFGFAWIWMVSRSKRAY